MPAKGGVQKYPDGGTVPALVVKLLIGLKGFFKDYSCERRCESNYEIYGTKLLGVEVKGGTNGQSVRGKGVESEREEVRK